MVLTAMLVVLVASGLTFREGNANAAALSASPALQYQEVSFARGGVISPPGRDRPVHFAAVRRERKQVASRLRLFFSVPTTADLAGRRLRLMVRTERAVFEQVENPGVRLRAPPPADSRFPA